MFTCVLVGLVNGPQWYFYVTNRTVMAAYYSTDSNGITWTATINSVVSSLAIIPQVVFMDTFKLRYTMLAASGTMVPKVNLGQSIACVPYIVISNVGGRLAAALLRPDQVSMATGICGMGLRLGAAIGFLLPSNMFSGLSEVNDIDEIGRRLLCWDCSLLAGSVICFILFFVFYRNDNEHGSAASNRRQALSQNLTEVERDTVSRGIKIELFMLDIRLLMRCLHGLLTRKDVQLLLSGHTILLIINYAFPAFYGQMMTRHLDGDPIAIIGTTGACYLLLGGVGGVFWGYLLDRTKRYKAISIGLIVTLSVLFTVFTFILPLGSIIADVALVSVIGFILLPLWTTGQNFGGELIYPEPESLYALLLTQIASILVAAFMPAAQAIMDSSLTSTLSGAQLTGIVFAAATPLAAILYAPIDVTLRRSSKVHPNTTL